MTEIKRLRVIEGKNFLWDGVEYENEEEVGAVEKGYREQGFEVQRLSAGRKVLLYTRRPVSSTDSS